MHYKQDGGNFAEPMLNSRKASEDANLKSTTYLSLLTFVTVSSLKDKEHRE
jgi:hypothetical protein